MERYNNKCKLRTDFLLEKGITKQELCRLYNASELTAGRWWTGVKYPSIDCLIDLAKRTGTNVEYLLSLTDVSDSIDSAQVVLRLKDIRLSMDLTQAELANLIGAIPATIVHYESKGITNSLNTLCALASALKVSIDYLLGLTKYKSWSNITPFAKYKGGSAMHIKTRSLKTNVLLSFNGQYIILPNNEKFLCTDEIFDGVVISPATLDEE